jgi:hypothetical protein
MFQMDRPSTPVPDATPAPPSTLDRLGATGSLLCAVHCAVLPVVLALVPSLGIAAWFGENFEQAFAVFATGLGLMTMVWGYRRHRDVRALSLLLPGLAILWFGVLFEPLDAWPFAHGLVMATGGALVGFAHIANLRLHHGAHVHGPGCAH